MRARTIVACAIGAALTFGAPLSSFAEKSTLPACAQEEQVLKSNTTSSSLSNENDKAANANECMNESTPADATPGDSEPEAPASPEPAPGPGWNLTEAGWEYRSADGSRVASSWLRTGGKWYYLGRDGIALTGRALVGGAPYYFDASCAMATGWARDGATGTWYYAEGSGRLAAGWRKVSGSWYWLDPETNAMATGLLRFRDGAYYLKPSGAMATGWARDGATGTWYYAEGSGRLAAGWRKVSGSWYWLDPETNAMAANEWRRVNNNSYRFAANGSMLSNSWFTDKAGLHYLDANGAAIKGRFSCSSGTYVFDSNNPEEHYPALTGFQTIDDKLYFFNDSAQMVMSSWVELADGNFGFASTSGVIGCERLKDGVLYLDGKTPASGFVSIESSTFYADPATGKLLTEWQTIEGKTYWFNPQTMTMHHGWFKDVNDWYWFDKTTGVMQTGWLKTGNNWYWLDSDGKMLTDWQFISGDWYYFTPETGAMYTGVLYWNGKYYLLSDSGAMVDLKVSNVAMFEKAQQYSSSTSWLIMVDTKNCRIGIYKGRSGSWKPVKEWSCCSGAPRTPTVLGQFTVTGKGYSFGRGYTCYYYTQFYGDYLFHSILYNQGTFKVQDGSMGVRVSHGCIRLALENAKWIYDYIPYGTKVVTY